MNHQSDKKLMVIKRQAYLSGDRSNFLFAKIGEDYYQFPNLLHYTPPKGDEPSKVEDQAPTIFVAADGEHVLISIPAVSDWFRMNGKELVRVASYDDLPQAVRDQFKNKGNALVEQAKLEERERIIGAIVASGTYTRQEAAEMVAGGPDSTPFS